LQTVTAILHVCSLNSNIWKFDSFNYISIIFKANKSDQKNSSFECGINGINLNSMQRKPILFKLNFAHSVFGMVFDVFFFKFSLLYSSMYHAFDMIF